MILNYFIIVLLQYQINQCNSETVSYFSTEHPRTYWYDRKYIKNFTWWNKRLTRKDPRHYMTLYFDTTIPFDNNVKFDFYFHQFLTNRYRPSFIELHFRLCNMLNFDKFVGEAFRKALGGRVCPFPAGEFFMPNISYPFIPKGFPFVKGRVYVDVSYVTGSVTTFLGNGSIDFELKTYVPNK